jgi:hypothetical protein
MNEVLADVILIKRQKHRVESEPLADRQRTIVVNFFDGKRRAVLPSDQRPADYVLELAGNPIYESPPPLLSSPQHTSPSHRIPSMVSFYTDLVVTGLQGMQKIVEAATGVKAVTTRNAAKLRTSPRGKV